MALFKTLSMIALLLGLGGCVVSGPGLGDMVDNSFITGSIAPAVDAAPTQVAAQPDQVSDRRTVRNAVSAADIEGAGGRYAWANPQTGANGVITALQEVRAGRQICRKFQTSRQRFDGIALYNGEACTVGEGEWALVRFDENR
ncbi:RT0821/Lpp0805 family surface protein [Aurantimonas sp. A3-2-R12]|uniref:RT0821/Lpp0805 family surface protein n=2 Tax=unclassified Aurantimonas TaxID=2638230 RepID=UPI002E18C1D5|nr:RT0821/Lpp0805 family surface protein [Aurantimonas sp. A3-2-R12]